MQLKRREFLRAGAALVLFPRLVSAKVEAEPVTPSRDPVIDIHQHTNYSDRTDEQLIAHQRKMGVTTTILLPAGRFYGLAARCGGNKTVVAVSERFPREFRFFANEVANLPEAYEEITSYLKIGAIGIGEQKFTVRCDSAHMQRIAEIAQEYDVPILLHFWDAEYNTNFSNFYKMLEKYPRVNFIGHAQTWWGNIDKNYDGKTAYPKGKVTPGGLADRWLSDYPNMYGDLSAGSGLNSLMRDEEQTRGFLERHQDKLMYGSDCNDAVGEGKACDGSQILAAVRRLSNSKEIERKILYSNAKRLFKLKQA